MVLYGATLVGVIAKGAHDGFMPSNAYQIIAIVLWPFIYGALPIAVAVIWLAIVRFNLSRAMNGLLVLAAVYLVVVFFRLLRSPPL